MRKYQTIDEVYAKFPANDLRRFKIIANKYGFTDEEAKEFLQKKIVHDQRIPAPKFMHIYSKIPHSYQMDTFIDNKRAGETNYLMLININTRKAYAFEMRGKGAKEVLKSLNEFIKVEPECKSILSDRDTPYLSEGVLNFMREHNIIYNTTLDNDHNKLSIINRFMRTVRDMRGNSSAGILDIVNSYNDMPHRSIDHKTPNEFTDEDEQKYIAKMSGEENPYKFEAGDSVRVVLDTNPFKKRRTRLTKESYVIDSKDGNQFLIRAADGTIETMPGYKLVKSVKNVPLASTINNGKRGIVKQIISYNDKFDAYNVVYELPDGSVEYDSIKAKNMREGHPTKLSTMERQFWIKQKSIPDVIRRFI